MTDRNAVTVAVSRAWARDTSAWPEEWTADNPAKGHCDVSSFVAWELLGGELVLGEVHVDGEFQEYHYWNRIDGADLDLTASQFDGSGTITEIGGHTFEELMAKRDGMRPELSERIDRFRSAVEQHLAGFADDT